MHARRDHHDPHDDAAPSCPPTRSASARVARGRFVGREHGAGISYFFVDNEPGEGPDLHWHPYTETWFVIEGEARITIGDQQLIATAGDTATVPAGRLARVQERRRGPAADALHPRVRRHHPGGPRRVTAVRPGPAEPRTGGVAAVRNP